MKYFRIKELCTSATATRLGIRNEPTEVAKVNLERLVNNLLDPLRAAWGGAIKVTSGYRSEALNSKIKNASKTSAHNIGCAADIVPMDGRIAEFKRFVMKWLKENDVSFDQYIDEQDEKGSEWVHIGLKNRSGKQRRQYLRCRNNRFTVIGL